MKTIEMVNEATVDTGYEFYQTMLRQQALISRTMRFTSS